MDLASVVAALASVGVRVSGSNPNNNIQEDSSRACPTGLAGPEPSGTHIDPGQHFQLPDMNAEEMAKEGFYLVKSVLRHRYRQGWRFLTLWEGFGVEEATWEPFSAFVLPEGRLNSVLVDYLSQNNLGELLRLAETLASKTKARD